jgi:hypothetical protein
LEVRDVGYRCLLMGAAKFQMFWQFMLHHSSSH